MHNRIPGQKLTSHCKQFDQPILPHKGGFDHGATKRKRRIKIPNPVGSTSKGQNGIVSLNRRMEQSNKFFCTQKGIGVYFLLAFLLLTICYGLFHHVILRLRYPITPFRNVKKQVTKHVKGIMSPFDSHPPKFGTLNVTGNIRHACLQEIRHHQHSIYIDTYIKDAHHILLVDPAYHSNVGDHMITIAELALLQQSQPQHATVTTSLSQCSYVQAHDFVPSCYSILQQEVHDNYMNVSSYQYHQNKVAIWHGGGNFGNLWSTAQKARLDSIVLLLQANYTIIGMPNSWYYTNEDIESKDMQQLRSNIIIGLGLDETNGHTITDTQLSRAVNSRIIWTWREHYSYERAVRLLPYCVHQLVPDIAYQLGPYLPIRSMSANGDTSSGQQNLLDAMNRLDIVFLLRNDHESIFASFRNRHSIQNIIYNITGASQLSFSIVDWDDRLQRFQPNNPNDVYFTETAIQLLSMGDILICDRLHAAILAYISDIAFIYLDQISGKIYKTFTVAMESGPSCQRSYVHSNIQNLTPKVDDAQIFWSHADTLSGAIETAVQILQQQKSMDATLSHGMPQRLKTREERRKDIRQKLINA